MSTLGQTFLPSLTAQQFTAEGPRNIWLWGRGAGWSLKHRDHKAVSPGQVFVL